ncbi:MAG: hypothetical protein RI898_1038, partial [Actinomycetota bacterium]
RDSSDGYTVPYLVAGCISLIGALIFTTSGPAEVTD